MSARGITFADVRRLSQQAGLDDIGVVAPQYWAEQADFMDGWLSNGLHGNMDYLTRNRDKRYDIRQLVPNAQTVIVALLSYAHSGHDYHRTMKSTLYRLQELLVKEFGQNIVSAENQHIFCDSAPVLERYTAIQAGLGFIGKNHQLIHPALGSMVHIGELVLQVPVIDTPEVEPVEKRCGNCTKCIDACPGKALGLPVWDARKCVAYITHKCIICQQVCPYNGSII